MLPLDDVENTSIIPFWTILIIIINVYVFWQQLTAADSDAIISQFALIPANINFSDPYSLFPFITSQFLHGGFLHIISNMLFLWVFGDNVEERMGYLLFPIFYLTAGAVGGLAQYIFIPDSSIPMVGASGAIAGVLGAYMAWFPRHTIKTLVFIFFFITIINVPAYLMLLYWIVTQIFSGIGSIAPSGEDVGGVAYFAHIGGFFFGYLAAKFIPNRGPQRLEPT